MTCRNCGRAVTEKTYCPSCFKGKGAGSCGCCQQNLGIHFIKRDVKLDNISAGAENSILISNRLCAAEVEISGFEKAGVELDKYLKLWKASVVHDGTVSAEINTAPARRGDFIQQICDIYKGLEKAGAIMTTTAGCHIHVDIRDYGYVEMAKMMYLWAAVEPALFTMVYKKRRANSFCVPCGMSYYTTLTNGLANLQKSKKSDRNIYRALVLKGVYGNKKSKVTTLKRDKGAGPRYRAVNIHSWLFRGSLEFRLPPGMSHAMDVVMWATTLSQLVDYAYKTELKDIQALCTHLTIKPEYFSHPQYWPSEVREAAKQVLLDIASGKKHKTWINTVYKFYDEKYDSDSRDMLGGICKAPKMEEFE